MKGEIVLVKGFDGVPALLRVVDLDDYAAYVSAPDQYERLANGLEALAPVGVLLGDVYRYVPGIETAIAAGSFTWSDATPYAQDLL